MKKKIIASALAAVALFASTAVFAATPKVVINNRTIDFEDQYPVITEQGRTLVPLRGVFERMGATVIWYAQERAVSVYSADGLTELVLKIDDNEVSKRKYTSILSYDEEKFTLESAPQIMNDRTMVPLRFISEALDCTVDWNEADYTITIYPSGTDSDAPATDKTEDNKVKMSISADKTDVNAGDEVKVYVNASNIENKDLILMTATSRVFYDSTKFEYVGMSAIINGKETEPTLAADNGEYNDDSVKGVYIYMDSKENIKDGAVMAYTFKALTDEGGDFSLSNGYSLLRGNDTSISAVDSKGEDVSIEDDDVLDIDTAPIYVK